MTKKITIQVILFLSLIIGIPADAAVWQWSVLVSNARENNGRSRAFLWIPPDCKKIRAVVFAQNNMEEQSILEEPHFRKALSELGFAEVWVSPAYNLKFLFNEGAGECFNAIMDDLASVSGYSELGSAPIAYIGHSAAASAPYYFGAWAPQRTLACISVSGQWPYVRNVFAPDIWNKAQSLDYVPCLETMGEYEAAATWSAEGLRERKDHPLMPLSMLACPAEFHFATSADKAAYIALYLKKTAQYRLPEQTPDGQIPQLIPIDPVKTGWLVDKWRFDQPAIAEPAPVGSYKGDRSQAFWYFDKEMAEATARYEKKHRGQKPELIGFQEHGQMALQRNVHQQFDLKFEPEQDGITFKVHTAFYDTVPGGSPRPAAWANAPVGTRVGHSKGNVPIRVDRITGPCFRINDSTFRVQPQLGFWEFSHSYELWFSASHPGDDEYKPAVQQALMPLPVRNNEGMAQHISFAGIPDQPTGRKGIKLRATSDAKLLVGFYVSEGPAEIVGDHLDLTAIPPRSRFPVKVSVVAWQYGNSNEPRLQTAVPVERSFWVYRRRL